MNKINTLWFTAIIMIFAGLLTGCGVNSGSGGTPQQGASGPNSVDLSWSQPTNADGSLIDNLKGFKIYYGTKTREYTDVINIDNPGTTGYTIENLPAGTYYFTITAYDDRGIESDYSNEESRRFD